MRLQPENRDRAPHAGLYIHIPFCIRKCPYCDFYSTTDLREMKRFVDVLMRELQVVTVPEVAFDTIYIGGGTPSLLTPSQLTGILQFAHMGDHRPVVLILPEQVGQDQQQTAS